MGCYNRCLADVAIDSRADTHLEFPPRYPFFERIDLTMSKLLRAAASGRPWFVLFGLASAGVILIATTDFAAGKPKKTTVPPQPVESDPAKLAMQLKLPDGFEVTPFAAPPMVNYPVSMSAAPDGTLYVSSDRNSSLDRKPHRGTIYRLRDTKGDGQADEVKQFVADVDSPRGLVWDYDRLYLMHPPNLSAFIDHKHEGVADEEKVLVKNIAFSFKDRPADHTSNGVTMGIDGWLYLAIGDFGMLEAEGADGRKLQFRNGGVLRVRPDGTNLEVYARGTRNILEVAVDPLLNMFTRDNTNDGDGWDTKLHHHTQLAQHGYPSLFKHFSDDAVTWLADYGGGSGCGVLYLSEPGFPAGYGDALYTCDWGRETIFRHPLQPRGASFTADQQDFVKVPRTTDMDVDANSHLYISSWKGAKFTYVGENVGEIYRVSPSGYRAEPLPDYDRADDATMVKELLSPSHRRRMAAQRTLIRRGLNEVTTKDVQQLCFDQSAPLACRVAAVFCLKQALHRQATPILIKLAGDGSIREYALRALTDRADELQGVPSEPFVTGLKDENPRVRQQACVSVARLGKLENAAAVVELLDDQDPRVAHTAMRAVQELKAIDAALAAVDQTSLPARREGALRALRTMHEPAVVDGLVQRLEKEHDGLRRQGLLTALCRLYFTDGIWKGDSWGTRPDTSGPYYQPAEWAETSKIAGVLRNALAHSETAEIAYLLPELLRHKIQLDEGRARILKLAATDNKLLPAAVSILSREKEIPADALPLLIKAAKDSELDPTARCQVVMAIAKTDSEEGLQLALGLLGNLKKREASKEYVAAAMALVDAPKAGNRVAMFTREANKADGDASAWADAVLLEIADNKSESPEAREQAAKSIEAGWANAKRKVQILHGIALSGDRKFEGRVLSAANDQDAGVLAAVKVAAEKLHVDIKPVHLPGPLVESMSADAAIDAVTAETGDAKFGENLFYRLSCTNCHTTKVDEPLRGPFLGTIATTYKRRELAESIRLPSKTIAQGFVTNVFELNDGKSLMGFVTKESADTVTIRNIDNKEIGIAVKDIDQRTKSSVSMMPEGLVKKLSIKEFACLLDFLESLSHKK